MDTVEIDGQVYQLVEERREGADLILRLRPLAIPMMGRAIGWAIAEVTHAA